ncbi:DNA-methyltransferase [Streptomyces sp. NPDC020965]|uniref:DNA-methyltransferase n=1 Tax=Streptomyces sp. NPDC020965 TaxID=3365105 RepID=UPI00379DFDD2
MERLDTAAEREAAAAADGVPARPMPLPPGRASVENGKLKDTPANRALHPQVTPQERFTDSELVDHSFYADEKTIVLRDDVRTGLQKLIDAKIKVDCIVTSPPYYGQRDYGYEGQLGLEERPQEFIDHLVEVFQLCWEVLSDTGSLWINIGDTYWSGKGAHKSGEAKQGARRFGIRPQDKPGDGKWARPKQLLLIPHRLAIALQDSGWLVRNDNVWVKPNPVPDQVRDRCSISHEYVFHFTKSRWYYFDRLAVGRKHEKTGSVLPPLDTWDARPSAGNGKHRAAFSDELVRIPVLATTPPEGIVLDPFNGSGTSMLFARSHGFRSIGIDLSDDYCGHVVDELKNMDSQLDLEL